MKYFNRLKTIRTVMGLKQFAVAEILGMSMPNVSLIESGVQKLLPKHERVLEEKWDLPKGAITNEQFLPVPIMGDAAAGRPSFSEAQFEGWLGLYGTHHEFGDVIAIHVVGDSMEPKIEDGDTVFVKVMTDLQCGDVGAFYYQGGNLIKKFCILDDGQPALRSINTKYEDILINPGDEFLVIGKVISRQTNVF